MVEPCETNRRAYFVLTNTSLCYRILRRYAPIAWRDIAFASSAKGRGFESLLARQDETALRGCFVLQQKGFERALRKCPGGTFLARSADERIAVHTAQKTRRNNSKDETDFWRATIGFKLALFHKSIIKFNAIGLFCCITDICCGHYAQQAGI